jgi:hypothetical protein
MDHIADRRSPATKSGQPDGDVITEVKRNAGCPFEGERRKLPEKGRIQ